MATQSTRGSQSFVVDNITFDLMTIVQKKSRALEAYSKYLPDTRRDPEVTKVIERVRAQDEQHIQELVPHLARLLANNGASMGAMQGGGQASRPP